MPPASCWGRACRSSWPRAPTRSGRAWPPAPSRRSMRTTCARCSRCGPDPMAETILVLNAGSSSIKFQLFAVGDDDRLARRLKGQIEGIGTRPTLRAKGKDGEILIDSAWPADAVADVPAALDHS